VILAALLVPGYLPAPMVLLAHNFCRGISSDSSADIKQPLVWGNLTVLVGVLCTRLSRWRRFVSGLEIEIAVPFNLFFSRPTGEDAHIYERTLTSMNVRMHTLSP